MRHIIYANVTHKSISVTCNLGVFIQPKLVYILQERILMHPDGELGLGNVKTGQIRIDLLWGKLHVETTIN